MDDEQQDEKSTEELLADAWSASEVDNSDDTVDSPEPTENSTEDSSAEASAGDEADADGDAEEQAKEELSAETAEASKEDGEAETSEIDVPPQSWNAQGREMWKELPKEAREYIRLREQQVAEGLEKHRQNAERAKAMDRSLAPYQQLFAMSGGAQPVIEGLLQTGATLQMGSPMQKAQTVANIIQRFGIDIGTLDDLLVGKQPEGQNVQQGSSIPEDLQRELAPLKQFVNQYQQSQQQVLQNEEKAIQNELTAFAQDPKNEFYSDVRNDMANILEAYGNSGRDISLAQAYKLACEMNPEIQAIVQRRSAANSLEAKRTAATTVHRPQRGTPATPTPTTAREALEQAWGAVDRV